MTRAPSAPADFLAAERAPVRPGGLVVVARAAVVAPDVPFLPFVPAFVTFDVVAPAFVAAFGVDFDVAFEPVRAAGAFFAAAVLFATVPLEAAAALAPAPRPEAVAFDAVFFAAAFDADFASGFLADFAAVPLAAVFFATAREVAFDAVFLADAAFFDVDAATRFEAVFFVAGAFAVDLSADRVDAPFDAVRAADEAFAFAFFFAETLAMRLLLGMRETGSPPF